MRNRMDWRSITFDWNRARAFLVTAEEGSFSAAARALGMTQPTLGRQVSALEAELGLTLFDRRDRGLALTPAGLDLLDHVRAMGTAAQAVALSAGGQAQSVEGDVAVTASEIYSAWLLPPIARTLRDRAPGITLHVVAANAIRDLKRREADIAIRNARPEQPDLIGRQIAEDAAGLYASPDYLAKLGPVQRPEDLAQARFIGFEDDGPYIRGLAAKGVAITREAFGAVTDNHLVHLDLARAGLGIGVLPCGLGDADPTLAPVLPEAIRFRYPVWLVAHRELRTSPRLRLVWDAIAEILPGLLAP